MLRQACKLWRQRWFRLRKVRKAGEEVQALIFSAERELGTTREREMSTHDRSALLSLVGKELGTTRERELGATREREMTTHDRSALQTRRLG